MKTNQPLDNKKYRFLLLAGGLVLLGAGIVMAQFEKKEKPTVNYQTKPVAKGEDTLLDGNWKYLAGAEKVKDGYLIKPLQRVIVEQNGAVAQKNSPINLAGTHIEQLKGDFVIDADIDLQKSTSATMQLYGAVPIIADEFKIERQSISIAVTHNKLILKVWDGGTQSPREVREFDFADAQSIHLSIARKQRELHFSINDKEVGNVKDPGLFTSGKIWFGLEAEDEVWKLNGLQMEEINGGSFVLADGSTVKVEQKNTESLQVLAQTKRKDFIVGGAMVLGPLVSDPEYARIALSDFNSLTPENEMKMINLQPKKGEYSFAQADALVHIAQANDLRVHGHTLVFGEANPPWLTALPVATAQDKQTIETIMTNHIRTVVSHYKDSVQSWDVINEPLADYDEFEQGQIMRNHKWYQAMGEEYIIKALETAHTANPNALLFINEYGLEADDDRWYTMYALLQKLKPQLEARNIPIEKVGVGFQSHIYEREDRINPSVLRMHIKELEQLGYKAQISELDVYSGDGDKTQSDQYVAVLNACLEEKNCVAWRVWIISDRYNFWKDEGQILNGKDGLYDITMQPRPALKALQTFLHN